MRGRATRGAREAWPPREAYAAGRGVICVNRPASAEAARPLRPGASGARARGGGPCVPDPPRGRSPPRWGAAAPQQPHCASEQPRRASGEQCEGGRAANRRDLRSASAALRAPTAAGSGVLRTGLGSLLEARTEAACGVAGSPLSLLVAVHPPVHRLEGVEHSGRHVPAEDTLAHAVLDHREVVYGAGAQRLQALSNEEVLAPGVDRHVVPAGHAISKEGLHRLEGKYLHRPEHHGCHSRFVAIDNVRIAASERLESDTKPVG
mmetsp:Transcript_22369/g.63462  ORF Transcript_22369/g.63462 Transcript_22369/m.63462 type:complete len:263 (-) Transcript_22369:1471-2259(-)